jgi:hypothetical protein
MFTGIFIANQLVSFVGIQISIPSLSWFCATGFYIFAIPVIRCHWRVDTTDAEVAPMPVAYSLLSELGWCLL